MPDRDLVPGVEVDTDLGRFRSTRRPATRRRTWCSTSPTAACCCRATTCSAASRSSTTTAGRPTRPASSFEPRRGRRASTCSSCSPGTAARCATRARSIAANRREVDAPARAWCAPRSPPGRRPPSRSCPQLVRTEASGADGGELGRCHRRSATWTT